MKTARACGAICLAFVILCFCFSGVVLAQTRQQVIRPEPSTQEAAPNTSVSLDVNYSTNPASQRTRGLGLRLHFDSSQLQFDGLANVFPASLFKQVAATAETADTDDGDPDTDAVVSVVWTDLTGANWPAAFPVRLYTATFTTAAGFNDSTRVNFTASSTTAGFKLAPQSATIRFAASNEPPTLDRASVRASAGGAHTCGVSTTGNVTCWGRDDEGQATPPAGSFTQVSAGDFHTCGVRDTGEVACWGRNDGGQATPPASAFTWVSAGGHHTCGVRDTGNVACWGRNWSGQATPAAGSFTQVSAGDYHTCGVRTTGDVACWGRDDGGQATPPTGSFTWVSAGGHHTCGLRETGEVACWGHNWSGQAAPPAGTFAQVSAGYVHTCGARDTGEVVCWGDDYWGQSTAPAGAFAQVGVGWYHTCGVRDTGEVTCWGYDGEGQATPPVDDAPANRAPVVNAGAAQTVDSGATVTLSGTASDPDGRVVSYLWKQTGGRAVTLSRATGSAATFTAPDVPADETLTFRLTVTDDDGAQASGEVRVTIAATAGVERFTSVSSGQHYTCGVRDTGEVACWGDDEMGQSTPPAGTFVSVSAGNQHTCGIRDTGKVVCWGYDGEGQSTPPAGTHLGVSAGVSHTCGVRETGAVACWGLDDAGQSTPPAGTFVSVSAGFFHTCGIRDTGEVACWGLDDEGQSTPPAGTFVSVSAGLSHTCGVRETGAVACWGADEEGQATPPVGTFVSVSTGLVHTCAIRDTGEVACWGGNWSDLTTPPASTFVSIGAGFFHTCGIRDTGILACWGDDSHGAVTLPTETADPTKTPDLVAQSPAASDDNPETGQSFTLSATVRNQGDARSSETTLRYYQASDATGSTGNTELGTDTVDVLAASDVNVESIDLTAPSRAGTYYYYACVDSVSRESKTENNCSPAVRVTVQSGAAQTERFISVTSGLDYTCGLRETGEVACWGRDVPGQLTPPAGTFTQISAGVAHACGIRDTGAVACWGHDWSGETTSPAGIFTQISAGMGHTCGIRNTGAVMCWGQNDEGQSAPPTGTFIQVSTGINHTCGIRTTGDVACWGGNEVGQLTPPAGTFTQINAGGFRTCGIRTTGDVACWGYDVQATPPAGRLTQVSVGVNHHACGIRDTGVVACWGDDEYGQATPPAGTFIQISAEGEHTCGVRETGEVVCWGDDGYGQSTPPVGSAPANRAPVVNAGAAQTVDSGATVTLSGTANDPDGRVVSYLWEQTGGRAVTLSGAIRSAATFTAPDVPADETLTFRLTVTDDDGAQASGEVRVTVQSGAVRAERFVSVTSGSQYACGLRETGEVTCWGKNEKGQATPPAGIFVQVSTYWEHTCGVRATGEVACWGSNFYGESTPPAGTFIQVSAGWYHTCGLRETGEVACWGRDDEGQSAPPAGTFASVSAGNGHTCGVRATGEVACWGSNFYGESTPPAGTFIQVSAGGLHTCGVRETGAVACWGSNFSGTPPSGSFIQVSGGSSHTCGVRKTSEVVCWGRSPWGEATPPAGTFTQVSAGSIHTCGVRETGEVVCWGDDKDYGQATPPAGRFIQVSGRWRNHTCGVRDMGAVACWGGDRYGQATPPAGTFTQVSAGWSYTCGLRETGIVACWGGDWAGQATPPAGSFIQVSAGANHTCGVRDTGKVACWGSNDEGQATPPAGTFTQVSAGEYHTCGARDTGAVACWGRDDAGQATPPAGNFIQVSAGPYHTCGVRDTGAVTCWGIDSWGQDTPPTGSFTQVSAGWTHTCGVRETGEVACWGLDDNGQSSPPAGVFVSVSAGEYHTCGVRDTGEVACWGALPFWAVATGTQADYQITVTDVRFDRAEPHDSDYWRYWVQVTATNTGARPFTGSSNPDDVWPGLFVEFYDSAGNYVGGVMQGIFDYTDTVWSLGEERTGTGFQYVPSGSRSTIAYYLLRSDDVACLGCGGRWTDVPDSTNRKPRATGSIPAQTLTVGGRPATVNVAGYFTDPAGDRLTYIASSSQTGVVTARAAGSTTTLTPVAAGSATVTVTARDPGGLTATQSIAVTVIADGGSGTGNRGPQLTGYVADKTVKLGESFTVDLSGLFTDPDGDDITSYGFSYRTSGILSGGVTNTGVLSLTAIAIGETTVEVDAFDGVKWGNSEVLFKVTVTLSSGNGVEMPVEPESMPTTQTCPDGSTITVGQTCPPSGLGFATANLLDLTGSQAPIVTPNDLDNGIRALISQGPDSLISTAMVMETVDPNFPIFYSEPTCQGTTCTFTEPQLGVTLIQSIEGATFVGGRRPILTKAGITTYDFGTADEPLFTGILDNVASYGAWMSHAVFESYQATSLDISGRPAHQTTYGQAIGVLTGSRPKALSAAWTGIITVTLIPRLENRLRENFLQGDATVTFSNGAGGPSIDVAFTSIADLDRLASHSISSIRFRDVGVAPDGSYRQGSGRNVIHGAFYGPGHAETAGVFEHSGIIGAFGALRQE